MRASQLLLIVLIEAGLLHMSPLFAQSVCSNQDGKTKPPDAKIRLYIEPTDGPNLIVHESARVTGDLRYENCDPVPDKDIKVRISDPSSKKVLYYSALDETGHFNLGHVRPGEYRISAELQGHGVFWRLAVEGRPTDLFCVRGPECNLQLMIWWKQTSYKMASCRQN